MPGVSVLCPGQSMTWPSDHRAEQGGGCMGVSLSGESFRQFPGAASCSLQLVSRQKILSSVPFLAPALESAWEVWKLLRLLPRAQRGIAPWRDGSVCPPGPSPSGCIGLQCQGAKTGMGRGCLLGPGGRCRDAAIPCAGSSTAAPAPSGSPLAR